MRLDYANGSQSARIITLEEVRVYLICLKIVSKCDSQKFSSVAVCKRTTGCTFRL